MSTISDGATTITPELVLGYTTQQQGRNIIHTILGRGNPDVSLGPVDLRSGTLELFFLTEAAAYAAQALHAKGGVFTYTASDNPTTTMRYVLASGGVGVALDERTRRRWTVTVAYQEVAA